MTLRVSFAGWLVVVAIAATAATAPAAEKPQPIQWSAKDLKGAAVQVPAAQRPTVMLFAMSEQPQSQQALKELMATVKSADGLQVILVVSGEQAQQQAEKLSVTAAFPGVTVADKDYSLSGRSGVEVWPTTVIVDSAGQVVAHLAGIPKSYAKDLDSYLAFAGKRIDAATLATRLAGHDVVSDAPEQVAARHLMVAQRLIDKGLAEQAKAELAAGLKLHPKSASLQLAMARVLVALGDHQEGLKILDGLEANAAPPSQLGLLRGKALVGLGKWEEALPVLKDAVKLNPQPAEGWYEIGRIHEHAKDWQQATEAYRKAFETTDTGRKVTGAGK